MIESKESVLKKLRAVLKSDSQWTSLLNSADALIDIHLAVFIEPYLDFIASGKKTIETRFSKNRIPPYQNIQKGDIILLKKSGAGISGACIVESAWFYNLVPGTLNDIRDRFGQGICPADEAFWDARKNSTFCSLIWISDFKSFDEIPFQKTDRRGWVILK